MLTPKQRHLLVYIIDHHLKENGRSPNFKEMKDAMKLRSMSGLYRLISVLEKQRFIRRHRDPNRAVEVLQLPERGFLSLRLPLPHIGTAETVPAAGLSSDRWLGPAQDGSIPTSLPPETVRRAAEGIGYPFKCYGWPSRPYSNVPA